MESVSSLTEISQASPFLGTCKHCGSPNLFLNQRGAHFGFFCPQCNCWQGRWIKHSEVKRLRQSQGGRSGNSTPAPIYKEVSEQVRADFDSPRDDSHKSCHTRFEKLENIIAGHDRELKILVKAILNGGVLQGKGGVPVCDVDDGLVSKFVEELQADNGN